MLDFTLMFKAPWILLLEWQKGVDKTFTKVSLDVQDLSLMVVATRNQIKKPAFKFVKIQWPMRRQDFK